MKHLKFFLLILITACNSTDQSLADSKSDTIAHADTSTIKKTDDVKDTATLSKKKIDAGQKPGQKDTAASAEKVYSNKRFKDVVVKKIGEHKYQVKGKGQIFEASFGWVVEDGHQELKKGFEMTDAGAPAWGNFEFIVNVAKERANSTLHLVLFETSAKDGSRQYELPILLY